MSESLHVACAACGASNRLPADRLDQQPRCGRCSQPLFSGRPLHLTDANIGAVLRGTDLPVIVDCWAEWCGPCRSFAPVFEEAAGILEPGFRLAKLDTDANPQSAAHFGIRSIPTLLAFRNGKETGRISGAMPLQNFLEWARRQAA